MCVELELACAGGYIRVLHFGKSKFPHCCARLKIIMLFQKKKRKRKGNEVSDNSQKKKGNHKIKKKTHQLNPNLILRIRRLTEKKEPLRCHR